MMKSTLWELWQAVKAPPRTSNPLYRYGVNTAFQINNALSCFFIFGALLFIMPLILLISTVFGAIAAAISASTVSKERQANRFTLLSVTPAGTFGASWLMSLGAVHRRDAYRRLQSWRTWAFRGAFIFMGYFIFEAIMIANNNAFSAWQVIILLLELVLVLVGFYIDHIQALTTGVLVGLAMPTYASDRIGAETGAVVFYLFVRVVTLLVAFLLMFGVIAPIMNLFPDVIVFVAVKRLLQFMAFVIVNEFITVFIWQTIRERLLADHESLQLWGLS